MEELQVTSGIEPSPRRRRLAWWLLGMAMGVHGLFVVGTIWAWTYALPKRPPPLLDRWQYSNAYDGAIVPVFLTLAGLAYVLTRLSSVVSKRKAVFLILTLEMFVAVALHPVRSRPREHANRTLCAFKLRTIGRNIERYANANDGRLPDGFEQLARMDPDSAHQDYLCPSSNGQRAEGATLEELLADFAKEGRCTYVYCGKGLRRPLAAGVVLAHERRENHQGAGMHMLFADGRVEWMAREKAERLINELGAGHNPPADSNR